MKKSLSLFTILLAMTLVACGGGEKSEAGKSSAGGNQSQASSERPTTSRKPTPSISVSSTDVVAKEGKVYLTITGTARNFEQENFKWALALQHIANESLDPLDTYIIGGASFADADYNTPVTIGDGGAFTFEYSLSDIATMAPGMYSITAGPKGYLVDVGSTTSGLNAKASCQAISFI